MRSRITGQITSVNSNAVPCQSLHVGHWRVAVEIGFVVDIFLQNVEDTGRGFFTLLARRYRAEAD